MEVKKIPYYLSIVIGFVIVGLFLYFDAFRLFTSVFEGILVKKPWTGTYYENIDSRLARNERFKTLEDCQSWAKDEAKHDLKEDGDWGYTCGLNCKYVGRTAGSISDNYECEQIDSSMD